MNPKLNAIGLVVADMSTAISFYGRLGLDFKHDDDSHAECVLPGGLRLMLDSEEMVRGFLPDWTRPDGGHRAALAFEFPTPAEVDTKFAELAEAGYRPGHEPWDAPWEMRYATVLDPDGNTVDLYCPLTRS